MRRHLIAFLTILCATSVHAVPSPIECDSFLNFMKTQDQDRFLAWQNLARTLIFEEAALVTLRLPRTTSESVRAALKEASIPNLIEAQDDDHTFATVMIDRPHLATFLQIGERASQVEGLLVQTLSRAERNILADESNRVRTDALQLLEEIAGHFVKGETLYSLIFTRVAEQTLTPPRARRFLSHRPPPRPIRANQFDIERFGLAWKLYLQMFLNRPITLMTVAQARADMQGLVELLKTKAQFAHVESPKFEPEPPPSRLGIRAVGILGKFLRRVGQQYSPYGLAQLGFDRAIDEFISPGKQAAVRTELNAIGFLDDDLYVAANLDRGPGPAPATERLTQAWLLFRANADRVNLTGISDVRAFALLESKLPPKASAPRANKKIVTRPGGLPLKPRDTVRYELSPAAQTQLFELNFMPADIEQMLETANGILIRDEVLQLPGGNYGTSMYAAKLKRVLFAELQDNVITRFHPEFTGAEARFLQEESEFNRLKARELTIDGHTIEIPARFVYKFKLMYDLADPDLENKLKNARIQFRGGDEAKIFLKDDPRIFNVKFTSAGKLFKILYEVELSEPVPPARQ